MARRHFGSVRRLPSGRYQASYWHDGRRQIAPLTFATKGDAYAHLATIETDLRRGTWVNPSDGSIRVAALAERWLASNPAKRPDTLATDSYHLKCHLLPALGQKRIADVTPHVLQQLVNQLSDRLAPKTVARAYGVVRAMFAYATDTDLIARSPCRGVRLPRVEGRRRQILTLTKWPRLPRRPSSPTGRWSGSVHSSDSVSPRSQACGLAGSTCSTGRCRSKRPSRVMGAAERCSDRQSQRRRVAQSPSRRCWRSHSLTTSAGWASPGQMSTHCCFPRPREDLSATPTGGGACGYLPARLLGSALASTISDGSRRPSSSSTGSI